MSERQKKWGSAKVGLGTADGLHHACMNLDCMTDKWNGVVVCITISVETMGEKGTI